MLQDITQAYTQFKIELNHTILCYLLTEQKKIYPENTIFYITKLLYGLMEIKNHWFATYLDYYKEKLGMEMLSYDEYLFIIENNGKNFGIIRFQTNDTFNIGIKTLMNTKETEITEGKFMAKSQTILETGISRTFNDCRMIIEAKCIMIVQKNQAEKFVLIDIKDSAKKITIYQTARLRSLYYINIPIEGYI